MRKKTVSYLRLFASIVIFSFITSIAYSAENLLPNPSFEKAAKDSPADWKTHIWQGKAEFAYAETGHSGQRSVKISSQEGGDASWTIIVSVEPFSQYRLSGWIKTAILETRGGEGALLNLQNIEGIKTKALTGNTDWMQVETTFETNDNDSLQINCLLGGGGLAIGEAWFDDLSLERISTLVFEPSVVIDASKEGAPISKYIYGQFIEHLGRCIYGGIWAEMLEDRKFYYAVGAAESPWKAVGAKAAVTMRKDKSYVGEHTPWVELAGPNEARGIVQKGLGLKKGMDYDGRIVLSGSSSAAPVRVSLIWGPEPWDRQTIAIDQLAEAYTTSSLHFTAKADAADGQLEIVSEGTGVLRIGTASLMPTDNVLGMRADTLKLLKELNAPIYRWPGGNFVSGYDWRDGVGERDQRPPRENLAWKGVEPNDFGLDEFIVFCREIGTEPLIVVNSGLGKVQNAVDELLYANGDAETPMGKLRAQNGSEEPYNVHWWGIGNEMYGDWQLGHMPLEDYVKKHNRFADEMRSADPSIQLIAVGAAGKWSETMLKECADRMDLISEHFYCDQQKGLLPHVKQITNNVRRISNTHRRYRQTIGALKGKDIRIAMDEWNYWKVQTLRDALGIAAGLNEFYRNSDIVFMANYAQTVNILPCIKTTKTDAAFTAPGLPLILYRNHYGTIPIKALGEPEPLDVAAAKSADGKTLTISIVNPTRQDQELDLAFKGIKIGKEGKLWRIAGDDEMASNEPGKEPQVKIEESKIDNLGRKIVVPPMSISLYEWKAE
ncbi:MAG: alpha-L-arabinofuranosidase C-terminal domain-containing protein [Candidatus Omnitrophota bacterium]